MNEALLQFVRERASDRCEYCHLLQRYHELPFQIDHIIAKKHRGEEASENLALACYNCNVHKGPNVAGIDPKTQQVTRLFHPRRDSWQDHFFWVGPELVGKTDVGRATLEVLGANSEASVDLRRFVLALGETFE